MIATAGRVGHRHWPAGDRSMIARRREPEAGRPHRDHAFIVRAAVTGQLAHVANDGLVDLAGRGAVDADETRNTAHQPVIPLQRRLRAAARPRLCPRTSWRIDPQQGQDRGRQVEDMRSVRQAAAAQAGPAGSDEGQAAMVAGVERRGLIARLGLDLAATGRRQPPVTLAALFQETTRSGRCWRSGPRNTSSTSVTRSAASWPFSGL